MGPLLGWIAVGEVTDGEWQEDGGACRGHVGGPIVRTEREGGGRGYGRKMTSKKSKGGMQTVPVLSIVGEGRGRAIVACLRGWGGETGRRRVCQHHNNSVVQEGCRGQ